MLLTMISVHLLCVVISSDKPVKWIQLKVCQNYHFGALELKARSIKNQTSQKINNQCDLQKYMVKMEIDILPSLFTFLVVNHCEPEKAA